MATKSKKSKEITIRSSAAEYLTFVSAIGDQPESVELRYQDVFDRAYKYIEMYY